LKILCFIDYYIPGFKAGGAIRTLANMSSQLSDDYEFLIVTRDRDLLDLDAYSNILIDQWNCVGKSKVFYASPKNLSFFKILHLLRETDYDILYLNSFFSPKMTVLPMVINLLGFSKISPIIVAPRGEFSASAIASRYIRKIFYIYLFNKFIRHPSVAIQASSISELIDIKRNLKIKNSFIASDFLPAQTRQTNFSNCKNKYVVSKQLRIIFLSRITPIKNLDYLLLVLKKIKFNVKLSVYGPKEDEKYWTQCQKIIQALPANINVKYHEEINHKLVSKVFLSHDIFVFPTKSENFGHVIFESLAAGTPVIISDNTPWLADNSGAVEVLSLKNKNDWVAAISRWGNFNKKTLFSRHIAALSYSRDYLKNKQLEIQEQNRLMFNSMLRKHENKPMQKP
jgi:glycosyltransferase involved in cell wall biosynthesis